MLEGTRHLLESGMMGLSARIDALARKLARGARDAVLPRKGGPTAKKGNP